MIWFKVAANRIQHFFSAFTMRNEYCHFIQEINDMRLLGMPKHGI